MMVVVVITVLFSTCIVWLLLILLTAFILLFIVGWGSGTIGPWTGIKFGCCWIDGIGGWIGWYKWGATIVGGTVTGCRGCIIGWTCWICWTYCLGNEDWIGWTCWIILVVCIKFGFVAWIKFWLLYWKLTILPLTAEEELLFTRSGDLEWD